MNILDPKTGGHALRDNWDGNESYERVLLSACAQKTEPDTIRDPIGCHLGIFRFLCEAMTS